MSVFCRAINIESDWAWINSQVPILLVEDTTGIIMFDKRTLKPLAACVLDNITANSTQAHFMITTPIVFKHGLLQLCFGYIFDALGVNYVYGLVPGDNEKAIKFNKRLGFTEKVALPEAFKPGVDYLLMELKKENCNFLPGDTNGQEVR